MTAVLPKKWRSRIDHAVPIILRGVAGRSGATTLEALGNGLAAFLTETVLRCSSVRTILYRDAGTPLARMYVPATFSRNGESLSEAEFCREVTACRRAILSGNAGTGKSIFTKRFTLRMLEAKLPRLPVLVELRNINLSDSSIAHHIRDDVLGVHIQGFDEQSLDSLLGSGSVTLILDGFDETHFERRDLYRREIDWLARRYPDLEILISTRPEEETLALDRFDVFRVLPLSLAVARSLVGKIPYDVEVKRAFLAALDDLYRTHFELASNPLLLTMLLLTFDQVGEISNKMHIFYNQAFETLVLKHDKLKSRYVRITRCSIDLETIKRAYAFFCARSYAEGELSFSESRAV